MKQWKAAGAGLAVLVLLALFARMGLGSGSTLPSLKEGGTTTRDVSTGPVGASDGRHRGADPFHRATIALPGVKADPAPLRLTRRMLEQAWLDGKLDVSLPDGGRYSVALEDQRLEPGAHWTVVGRVPTRLGPQAMVLTFGPDAVFGVLPSPDGSLMQVTTTRGQTEIAAAGGVLPPGSTSRLAAEPDYVIPRSSGGKNAARIGAIRPREAAPQSTSSVTEIVVLGAYSGDLVDLRGSVSAAETEVTNLFAIANQAHLDSGTQVQLKLAGLQQVDVDPLMSNDSVLRAATDNTIPGVDLHQLRDNLAADLVALVRPYHDFDWTCGIAWMNGGGRWPQGISDYYGYSVSNVAPCGPHVLAHEIGHNIGSAHDRETMTMSGHLDYGVYEYSFGYRQDGPPAFATVMAYAVGGQPWLGYFSSPGSTSCGAACGVRDQADNVRSLRTIAPVIAGFRGPPGTLSIVDAEAYESDADGPTAYLYFMVRLSGIAPAGGVTFDVLLANGTAAANVDYLVPTQIGNSIPEGQREAWVTVELVGDALLEADETIKVTLTNVTGATVHDGAALGRIVNDDPRLKLSGRVAFEGAPAPASSFWLSVSGLSSAHDGTAVEVAPPDFAYEVSVVKGAAPTFAIDAPAPFAILPFTLGEVEASRVRDIKLKKGVHVTGKVKLPPGQPALTQSLWLDFRASIDGVSQPLPSRNLEPPNFEYSEWVVPGSWVYMELTPPAPYKRFFANRPEARADFVQDIPLSTLPSLIIWTISRVPEGPPGAQSASSFVVELSAPAPAGGVTLRYRTVDGTARAGSDYQAVSGTLKIPEGESVAYTADVNWTGDRTREGDETFYVVVSDVVGANPVVTRVEMILNEQEPRMSGPLPPVPKR